MKIRELLESEDPWEGIPWRYPSSGDYHGKEDVPPKRDANGDFIFYHGTSMNNAEKILSEKRLKHDDLGYCGVATTEQHAMIYGTMKGTRDKSGSALLRVKITRKWFDDHPNTFARETGGSGKNQFLIKTKELPLLEVKLIRSKGEPLEESLPKRHTLDK